MKKAELQFSPVVYAILALVVLVVCIMVFFFLTGGSFKNIFKIEQDVGNQNNQVLDDISILFQRCEESDIPKCSGGKLYICNTNKKWEKTDNACP